MDEVEVAIIGAGAVGLACDWASWSSSLEVTVKTSGGGPDLLGDTPTLVINPGADANTG